MRLRLKAGSAAFNHQQFNVKLLHAWGVQPMTPFPYGVFPSSTKARTADISQLFFNGAAWKRVYWAPTVANKNVRVLPPVVLALLSGDFP
jgi:hypothetical protein